MKINIKFEKYWNSGDNIRIRFGWILIVLFIDDTISCNYDLCKRKFNVKDIRKILPKISELRRIKKFIRDEHEDI